MGKKSQIRREKKEQYDKERKQFRKLMEAEKSPWLNFWKRINFWVYVVCFFAVVAYPFIHPEAFTAKNDYLIKTSQGDITVELYPDAAPNTVSNFEQLVTNKYYDGLLWHRVIKGFMIQSGDPSGDGTGGESASGADFADEINPQSLDLTSKAISDLVGQGYKYNYALKSHKMEVGSLAMANRGPNTNASQFFIVTEKDQAYLNGKHTVFGKVIKDLDVAVAISAVPVDANDKPLDPVYVISITKVTE
ncbi:MAG: peptidylprolyl isomerase [Candidatus Berkelbacteria bacterium]